MFPWQPLSHARYFPAVAVVQRLRRWIFTQRTGIPFQLAPLSLISH